MTGKFEILVNQKQFNISTWKSLQFNKDIALLKYTENQDIESKSDWKSTKIYVNLSIAIYDKILIFIILLMLKKL